MAMEASFAFFDSHALINGSKTSSDFESSKKDMELEKVYYFVQIKRTGIILNPNVNARKLLHF
jgi:hypothetical protein